MQTQQTRPGTAGQSWEQMINRDLPYDEMRREYVAELVARRTQLEATQQTETDPNERIRLREALMDLNTELQAMWKLVPDLAPTATDSRFLLMEQVEQRLRAKGSSMRAWCRQRRTSRSRLAAALRGNDTSAGTQREARTLLAELGLEDTTGMLTGAELPEEPQEPALLVAVKKALKARGSSLEQWSREHGMSRARDLTLALRTNVCGWTIRGRLETLLAELGIEGDLPTPISNRGLKNT